MNLIMEAKMETNRKEFSLRELGTAFLVLPLVWPQWAGLVALAIVFEVLYLL